MRWTLKSAEPDKVSGLVNACRIPPVIARMLLVRGIDKQVVGEMAAKVRSIRPPEPYKGKGIRYAGEYVQRKVGKRA